MNISGVYGPRTVRKMREKIYRFYPETYKSEERTRDFPGGAVVRNLPPLPMQGTRVQVLVWEDPTCHRATKPVHHNW